MSLFTIDITRLLQSPVGSFDEYQFEEEVPKDTWEDLTCESPLSMNIKIVREKYGLSCIIHDIMTSISVPADALKDVDVELENIAREFHIKKSPEDTDDIGYIDMNHCTIDLTQCIREELLISVV